MQRSDPHTSKTGDGDCPFVRPRTQFFSASSDASTSLTLTNFLISQSANSPTGCISRANGALRYP